MLSICIFALSGCNSAPAPGSTGKSKPITNVLTDKGLELIEKVDKLAECKTVTDFYTGDAEINNIIKDIAKNDYSTPQGVFVIEDLDSLVFDKMMPETKLPEDIAKMLKGRFASTLPTQITAMSGAMRLAATSILSYGESFICEKLKEPVTYLYTYGNDYSFMVNYIPNDEHIVGGNVAVVIHDKLSNCASQEDVIAFFADVLSFEEISVSVVMKEK